MFHVALEASQSADHPLEFRCFSALALVLQLQLPDLVQIFMPLLSELVLVGDSLPG
jgi:hypothetical protein